MTGHKTEYREFFFYFPAPGEFTHYQGRPPAGALTAPALPPARCVREEARAVGGNAQPGP